MIDRLAIKYYASSQGAKSILNTRVQKVPERFVIKLTQRNKKPMPDIYTYRMVSKEGQLLGEMKAFPMFIVDDDYYPKMKNYLSFYIKNLDAKIKNLGVGTDFIKIAKKESSRTGCDGKVHLFSIGRDKTKSPPSIFYRKNGFYSQDSSSLDKIDRYIYDKTNRLGENCWELPMYLPVNFIEK